MGTKIEQLQKGSELCKIEFLHFGNQIVQFLCIWNCAWELGKNICLHNSWTPIEIKEMSKKEFLELGNTLSEIFRKILY